MPGLLETTAHIVTATVGGSAKACIDAADDPSPVVRARSWSIGIIAVGEHGRWQHASLEGAVLEVAQLGCADRRGASDQHEFVGRGKLHHLAGVSRARAVCCRLTRTCDCQGASRGSGAEQRVGKECVMTCKIRG